LQRSVASAGQGRKAFFTCRSVVDVKRLPRPIRRAASSESATAAPQVRSPPARHGPSQLHRAHSTRLSRSQKWLVHGSLSTLTDGNSDARPRFTGVVVGSPRRALRVSERPRNQRRRAPRVVHDRMLRAMGRRLRQPPVRQVVPPGVSRPFDVRARASLPVAPTHSKGAGVFQSVTRRYESSGNANLALPGRSSRYAAEAKSVCTDVCRLCFERAVHSLVPPILLRMARLDPLGDDAELDPPDR
jgi:hypothetical protein